MPRRHFSARFSAITLSCFDFCSCFILFAFLFDCLNLNDLIAFGMTLDTLGELAKKKFCVKLIIWDIMTLLCWFILLLLNNNLK